MRRYLRTDKMQRKEERFGNGIKAKVRKKRNGEGSGNNRAKHNHNDGSPVLEQKFAGQLDSSLKCLLCSGRKNRSRLQPLFDLLLCHRSFPYFLNKNAFQEKLTQVKGLCQVSKLDTPFNHCLIINDYNRYTIAILLK